MVRGGSAFLRRRFGGKDVHALINLHGIARDDFPIYALGQRNGHARFAGRGWPDNAI